MDAGMDAGRECTGREEQDRGREGGSLLLYQR